LLNFFYRIPILQSSNIKKSVRRKFLLNIAKKMKFQTLKYGDNLYHYQDNGDMFYVVVAGILQLYVICKEHEDLTNFKRVTKELIFVRQKINYKDIDIVLKCTK